MSNLNDIDSIVVSSPVKKGGYVDIALKLLLKMEEMFQISQVWTSAHCL